MDTSFTTPVDALQQRAQAEPDKLAFLLLDQGEVETERMTFAELDRGARELAAYLQSVSEPGERALLILPTGLEFIKAMYACLYAGIVPIPTNPPGMNRSVQRLEAIVQDANATLALTTPWFLQLFESYSGQYPELRTLKWVTPATIQPDLKISWQKPDLSPERLAFIQYTSGSTNVPKGVVVSYRNLSYDRYAILTIRGSEYADDSIILSWVPLFHDMGLLIGVFQGVFDGNPSLLMTPMAFMQQPLRWLKAISQYKATLSGGPNFAYDVCANKISLQECEGLDLSSWRIAFNSAEPVRAESQSRFAEKFAPLGFRHEAFHPCYGLAEATLVVSGYGGAKQTITFPANRSALEQGRILEEYPNDEKNCQHLVSCGPLPLDLKAAIVNPVTCTRCAPDEIGEIWVSGDSIAEGYWNRPEETQAAFRAMIRDTGEGPFLRAGDLGFLHAGELYVTGRYKDMIIVRGRNYYPQDIEFTVQKSHPALRPGSVAAFAIKRDGNEQLVVVQEVRQRNEAGLSWDEVIKTIRADIAREHGIRAHSVILIERGAIPKTSSGKIMRSECRSLFENNELDIVAEWRAPM